MDVTDWLIGISAVATLALAIAAFLSIKVNRRDRLEERHKEHQRLALERIRGWAEGISELIMHPTLKARTLPQRLKELDVLLQASITKSSFGVLEDAKRLGDELYSPITDANSAIAKFMVRLRDEEAIAKFKNMLQIEDELKPIGSLEELLIAKKELLCILDFVIESATKRLVPLR